MRLAFDIGGTFTDVVFVDDHGELHTAKLLSLLDRVGADILQLFRGVSGPTAAADFIHGTTIASNAVIEGTLVTVGAITTQGFRDALDMRGQRRPPICDVTWDRLPPLTRQALCREVGERVRADGSVERRLDEDEVRSVVRKLLDQGVQAIAVSLINSYAAPDHERRIGEVVRNLAPGLPVCLSSDRFAVIGEYERISTTAVNAGLVPIVRDYLTRLEEQLEVGRGEVLIMQSTGGLMNSDTARLWPVQMIESGPAAGVLASARLGQELGLDEVIAFDMGGTTAKASTISGGRPVEKPQGEMGGGSSLATRLFGGGGHVVRVPSFDIVEVGAGGGSIAWIDSTGALRVGPRSAGADPGPVCYGRGGTLPTVTDANLVLGYLNPAGLAAGSVSLDCEAAREALTRSIARPLGMDVLEAAFRARYRATYGCPSQVAARDFRCSLLADYRPTPPAA